MGDTSRIFDEERTCPECGGPKSVQARRCAKCAGNGQPPEERSRLPLCGARKKDGGACRAFAGQGTDHFGIGRCKFHGGATVAHRHHAVALEAKRRMVTLGAPVENTSAPDALMGLLRASAGHVAWLQQEVAELDTLGSHEAQVVVRLYDEERTMLVRISEAAVRAGVATHIVRIEAAHAEMTLHAIREAALDAGLDPTQLQALGVALRKRLAEASDDPARATAETEAADAKLAELRERIEATVQSRIEREASRRVRELSALSFPPEEWAPDAD